MKFPALATVIVGSLLGVAINIDVTYGLVTPQQAVIKSSSSSYDNYRNHGPLRTDASAVAADLNDVPRGGASSVGGGTATIPNEVFNLVKSIVGAGVLSLPAGRFLSHGNAHLCLVLETKTNKLTSYHYFTPL